jgi:hypothetical protein
MHGSVEGVLGNWHSYSDFVQRRICGNGAAYRSGEWLPDPGNTVSGAAVSGFENPAAA